MALTARLTMTLLDEGQRGKETTINDSLTLLDTNIWKDMGEYTVAGLPAAVNNPNAYALATNASGGRTVCRSNGTVWKVIAVEGLTVA